MASQFEWGGVEVRGRLDAGFEEGSRWSDVIVVFSQRESPDVVDPVRLVIRTVTLSSMPIYNHVDRGQKDALRELGTEHHATEANPPSASRRPDTGAVVVPADNRPPKK